MLIYEIYNVMEMPAKAGIAFYAAARETKESPQIAEMKVTVESPVTTEAIKQAVKAALEAHLAMKIAIALDELNSGV